MVIRYIYIRFTSTSRNKSLYIFPTCHQFMAIHGMDVPTSGASGSSKAPAASLPAAPATGAVGAAPRIFSVLP